MKKKNIKINDPIHGFIIFPETITRIIDTYEVQRLRRIRQLSGADQVFPGANHTRFEHSLGVAALAQRLLNLLNELHDASFTHEDIELITIAALLHDVGHGPFSHNFEPFLLKYNMDHEDMTMKIINDSELGDVIEDLGYSKSEVAEISSGNAFGSSNIKYNIFSQILASSINVDSMDYLLRDNYHCGISSRAIDINRLLLSIDICEEEKLAIDIKAQIALESYFFTRINSFKTIYFHKTCRAMQLVLSKAIELANEDFNFGNSINTENYLALDDYSLWTKLKNLDKTKYLIHRIEARKLPKMIFERSISGADEKIIRMKGKIFSKKLKETLGKDAEKIFIDTPFSSNIPYIHSQMLRKKTPFLYRIIDGNKKELIDFEESTEILNYFSGHSGLIRVYTWGEYQNELKDKILKFTKGFDWDFEEIK